MGCGPTLVDQADEPMATVDPDLARQIREAMEGMDIAMAMGAGVEAIETGDGGWVRAVATGSGTYPADIVVLGIGVRPRTDLADAAGLPLGESGGLRTDSSMRSSSIPASGPRVTASSRGTGCGAGSCTCRSAPTRTSRAACWASTSPAATGTFPGIVGDRDDQGVRPGDRPGRLHRPPGGRGRSRRRVGDDRDHDAGGLLPRRRADDGAAHRRAGRAAARRPDRRPERVGAADRHGGDRAVGAG